MPKNEFETYTKNNIDNKLNDKQAKLPNSDQVGKVLTATNTEGGTAWTNPIADNLIVNSTNELCIIVDD